MIPEESRVIDALPGLVWTALPDGRIEYLNERWRAYTGLSLPEASGLGWQSALFPADLPPFLERWRSIVAAGEPGEMEARLRRCDGAYRWFLFRLSPIAETAGRVTKWCGINSDIEDYKQIDAPRADEPQLNAIIDTIPTYTWSTLPDGSCDFLSQRWLNYAGMSREDGRGWGWSTAVYPDDAPGLLEYWKVCLASGSPVDAEARVRRHDGVYRWFLFLANPLRDEAGNIVRWYGTNIDIEDRKQAETVRASERNLWRIVNNIPGSVCVLSTTGEVIEVNQPLLDHFGKTLAELKDWKMSDLVHPDDRSHMIDVFSRSMTTGAPYTIEVRCRRSDGIYQWTETRARPVRDADGCINGWYILLTDIEDKKRAEEALQATEHRLNKIVNTIPTTAWFTRPDGYCEYLNERWLGYAGLTEDEARGWGWSKAIHPDDLPELVAYWQSCLATGTPVDTEARIRRHDGVYRWFIFRANPLRDDAGNILNWYGTNVDIEDRKQTEEELRRSEIRLREAHNELAHVTRVTTMGELAASIAHEINQPVAGVVINGNACLRWLSRINDESVPFKEARETIRRIIRDGNRAGEIIARIRTLFKKTSVARESLDINEAIREIIVLARNEIDKQRVALRLELSADLPRILGDRVQLQQVILNLILNGVEAMATVQGRSRDLVIQSQSSDKREVMVAVRDTGIGLAAESIDHVFTAFHTTKPGGLGMGLSISRSIVENHSGKLWVTGLEGPGVSFCFALPVQSSAIESDVQQ